MSEPTPPPSQPPASSSAGDAVSERNKYAERMTHQAKQPPAMKIAIGITLAFLLVFALAIFIATGGPAKLMGKPAGRAAIEITVPARA